MLSQVISCTRFLHRKEAALFHESLYKISRELASEFDAERLVQAAQLSYTNFLYYFLERVSA